MKKLVMTVAVLTCAASVVLAQTVTSANMVGYSKSANVAGLQIGSAQFDTGNNTPEGLFGSSLPVGSKIYKYDPVTGYIGLISTYESVFISGDQWSDDLVFQVGDGFWYESLAGGTVQWVVNRPFTP